MGIAQGQMPASWESFEDFLAPAQDGGRPRRWRSRIRSGAVEIRHPRQIHPAQNTLQTRTHAPTVPLPPVPVLNWVYTIRTIPQR
jgi:hypothetical protein